MVTSSWKTIDGPGLEAPISLRQMLPNATVKVGVAHEVNHLCIHFFPFWKTLEKAKKAQLNLIQVDSCLIEVSRCIHVFSSIFFSNSIIITYLESVYGLHGLHDLEQPNSWDVARGKPTHWLLDLEHWHGCLKDGGQAARAPMPGGDHLRRFRDHRHGQEVQTAPSFQGAAMERMRDKDTGNRQPQTMKEQGFTSIFREESICWWNISLNQWPESALHNDRGGCLDGWSVMAHPGNVT